jgi:hypothetical protein
MAIALRIMRHPAMKLHGPEHQFLVPAVLVAAYSNARGEAAKRAERVADARRRSDAGHGAAPGAKRVSLAALGAGTFVTIANGSATTGKGGQLASKMTARAVTVIGSPDGSSCCRRDSMLAILAAVKFAHENLAVQIPTRGPGCEWSTLNKECNGPSCPFNR